MSPPAEAKQLLDRTASGSLTSMHVGCPICGQSYVIPVPGPTELEPEIRCDSCGTRVPVVDRHVDPSAPVRHCAVCGCEEFYVQKDFNRLLGLWVVVATALIAFLVMLWQGHLAGLVVLLAVTLLDWAIYRRLRDVSICYKCNTIYRSFPRNPEHGAFYLGSEEKYKKLRLEWIEALRE